MTDPIDDAIRGLKAAHEIADSLGSAESGDLIAAAILLATAEVVASLNAIEQAIYTTHPDALR